MSEEHLSSSNPFTAFPDRPSIVVLLVDDQEMIAEQIKRMVAEEQDITLHYCSDPKEAIAKANEVHPTVILQDLMMPKVDGLTLVRYFRANTKTQDVPMIVLSAKEEGETKAQAFALGANDYIVKLPDPVELLARIRYHSKGYIRHMQRNDAFHKLRESQDHLRNELQQASDYVQSQLPQPAKEEALSIDWKFIPSAILGGDIFGYHWIDEENFAIYLLDVCGHGVGAALMSASVVSFLRTQKQEGCKPDVILQKLNETFQMEEHQDMYFTMWYGVWNKKSHTLRYSGGGHPPSLLLEPGGTLHSLEAKGMVVGALPQASYTVEECSAPRGSALFLYSDGAYELNGEEGTEYKFEPFLEKIKQVGVTGDLDEVVAYSKELNQNEPFGDDYSLVRVIFH